MEFGPHGSGEDVEHGGDGLVGISKIIAMQDVFIFGTEYNSLILPHLLYHSINVLDIATKLVPLR